MQSPWCSPENSTRPQVQNIFNFCLSTASPPPNFADRKSSKYPSPCSSRDRSPVRSPLLPELSPALAAGCMGSSFTMQGNFGGWGSSSEPVAKRLCLGSLSAVATPALLPSPNSLLSPICISRMSPACPAVPTLVSLPSPQINTAFGLLSPRSLQTNAPLVGDFSRPHLLPVLDNQAEVKKITSCTLRKALRGELNKQSSDVQPEIIIVDCRYPYEYEGGHITGAINLYGDESMISELFRQRKDLHSKSRNSDKPVLVVFHCEFSVKRSVDRLRHLRKRDRLENVESYPRLFYPEVYLLSGGYCDFYSQSPDMCSPQAYVTMKDGSHSQEFIRFSRGKTYDGGSKQPRKLRRFGSTRL